LKAFKINKLQKSKMKNITNTTLINALLYRIKAHWWLELKEKHSFHAAKLLEFDSAKRARYYARKLGICVKRAANCDRLED